MNGDNFDAWSRKAAADFLKTVVIVDDRSFYDNERPGVLENPGRTRDGGEAEPPAIVPNENIADDELDARQVIAGFAKQGIVCSILFPTKKEAQELTDTLEALVGCTDVMVVDWNIHGDHGAGVLELIKDLVTHKPDALRLLIIYSGAQELEEIAERVGNALGEQAQAEEEGFILTVGARRVVILGKPKARIPGINDDRYVPFADLAERVIEEFAKMTGGIVPNLVLKSLASVRDNTHKILARFSRELDAPYLTHRTLLPAPSDAETLLISLIAQELREVLEDAEVGQELDKEKLRAWVRAKGSSFGEIQGKLRTALNNLHEDEHERVVTLVWDGLRPTLRVKWKADPNKKPENIENDTEQRAKELFKSLTNMLKKGGVGEYRDERFAHLTTIRSHHGQPTPILTLGTIVKEITNNQYFLCIQPRCDTVRVKDKRVFVFLPLELKETGKKYDFLIGDSEGWYRLKLDSKPYNLRLIGFSPLVPENQTIKASKSGDSYLFTDVDHNQYQWLGELRTEHAQRVAHEFSAKLARVGVDESEWLRLDGQKYSAD